MKNIARPVFARLQPNGLKAWLPRQGLLSAGIALDSIELDPDTGWMAPWKRHEL
jgi:hypothetical protein